MLQLVANLAHEGGNVRLLRLARPQRRGALHQGAMFAEAAFPIGRAGPLSRLQSTAGLLLGPFGSVAQDHLLRCHTSPSYPLTLSRLETERFIARARSTPYHPGMSRRLSIRVPDELAEKIDAQARHLGKTRSDVIRDALTRTGPVAEPSPILFSELLKRAAALRARQPEPTDVAALIREIRDGAPLRLRLMRLTVPLIEADLA